MATLYNSTIACINVGAVVQNHFPHLNMLPQNNLTTSYMYAGHCRKSLTTRILFCNHWAPKAIKSVGNRAQSIANEMMRNMFIKPWRLTCSAWNNNNKYYLKYIYCNNPHKTRVLVVHSS